MFSRQEQRKHIKTTLSYDLTRKKRSDRQVTLRKKRRHEHLQKRRREDTAMYGKQVKAQIDMIPQFYQKLRSQNSGDMMEATVFFRKLLSIERNPPIDEVVKSGSIEYFVKFVQKTDSGQLQFEALWALTNICSGNEHHVKQVLRFNTVPILIKLLNSPYLEVREQSIWALGNISGEGPRYRDYCLNCGILLPLLNVLRTPNIKMSVVRNAVWTISNLCRGRPRPSLNSVKPAVPYLAHLIYTCKDPEVLTDACWAISYISDGKEEDIQAILDQKLVKVLVRLLYHRHPAVQTPALRTIGNIVTGTDDQTQVVISNGALVAIRQLLNHSKLSIRKESVWTISNITAGTPQQIQAVFEANIFQALIQIVTTAEFQVKREAAWAISNATSSGTEQQVWQLVKLGCIKPLCDLLAAPEKTVAIVALEGLENILRAGSKIKKHYQQQENPFAVYVEKADGTSKLEALHHHSDREVFRKANRILEEFFEGVGVGGGGGLDDDDGDGLDSDDDDDDGMGFGGGGGGGGGREVARRDGGNEFNFDDDV